MEDQALAGAGLGRDQSPSLEEWEAKTFEKQPPEAVMDAAGRGEDANHSSDQG